jgi:hypothetical protein
MGTHYLGKTEKINGEEEKTRDQDGGVYLFTLISSQISI